MARYISAAAAAERAGRGGRILLAGCTADPAAILDAVAADPGLWRGRRLTGAFIPGVNERDYSALGEGTTVETVFLTGGLRADRAAGHVAHLPLHYTAFWARLARPGVVDWLLAAVPPPGPDGRIGLGPTCDFAPAALAAGARLIGVVNPEIPDVPGTPRIDPDRFDALVDGPGALPELSSGTADDASRAIAAAIVAQIPEGGTLQIGLGKLQAAVLEALAVTGRRDVGFHGGMISEGVLDWQARGGFTPGITTGVALGSAGFYRRLRDVPEIAYAPVAETHGLSRLAALPGLVSVNSVLEVDLTGQANAEYVGGRQVSGHGGMVDFIRGARASTNGRAILALPATARGGSVSRIVATLPPGTPVSVARSDIDMVVTEYGAADLREADLETRAARLIAIAAPAFRDALAEDWTRSPR